MTTEIRKMKEGSLEWAKFDGPIDTDPEVERICEEIVSAANKHNDNDWWEDSEQIAINAVRTALIDRELIIGMAKKWNIKPEELL